MAPKRLADIAAPAPEAQSEPTVEVKKESAKQRARIEKGLAETRVDSIRLDGLALMKIIKHCREAHQVIPAPQGTSNATVSFSPAVGQLLGIDSNGTLEISNSFGLPAGSLGGNATGDSENESRGLRAATKYTSQLLPRLSDLNADAAIVGFYTSTNNGQTLATAGFVDALLEAQLSGGGIGAGVQHKSVGRTTAGGSSSAKNALASGTGSKNGKGIGLVYDVASAGQGHVKLTAYRLTAQYIQAARQGKFDTQSLIANKLVPTNILEEVPVTVTSSPLLTAFLSTLVTPTTQTSTTQTSSGANLLESRDSPLSAHTSFNSLSLPTAGGFPSPLTAPLLALLTSLETHQAHLSTLSFQSRQLGRDRAKLDSNPVVAKRRAENEQRAKDGLPSLPPTAEELALQEPSRLETMCALAGVEGAAKVLSEATGTAIVRGFGSRAATVA